MKRASLELVALGRLGRAVLTCCQRTADKQKNLRGGPNSPGGGGCRQGGVTKINRREAADLRSAWLQALLSGCRLFMCRASSTVSWSSESSLTPGICHAALIAPFVLTRVAHCTCKCTSHVSNLRDYFNTCELNLRFSQHCWLFKKN